MECKLSLRFRLNKAEVQVRILPPLLSVIAHRGGVAQSRGRPKKLRLSLQAQYRADRQIKVVVPPNLRDAGSIPAPPASPDPGGVVKGKREGE